MSTVYRDRRLRFLYQQKELRWQVFRSLVRTPCIGQALRARLYSRLYDLSPRSSVIRVRNRCFLTGRSGSPQSPYPLFRQSFRELANNGLLPGVARSSWLI